MTEDLQDSLNKIIMDSRTFFEKTLEDKTDLVKNEQENSIINYDINYKNYELGSYGIRKHKNLFHWVYGTGCAEPRLSLIKKI